MIFKGFGIFCFSDFRVTCVTFLNIKLLRIYWQPLCISHNSAHAHHNVCNTIRAESLKFLPAYTLCSPVSPSRDRAENYDRQPHVTECAEGDCHDKQQRADPEQSQTEQEFSHARECAARWLRQPPKLLIKGYGSCSGLNHSKIILRCSC